jgi:hypothetical protein
MRLHGACVGCTRPALDEGAPLEHIHDPGDPAQAQAGLPGQGGQPHTATLRRGQAAEHLDPAEAEPVTSLELGIQLAREAFVRLQQADPGIGLRCGPLPGSIGQAGERG